MSDRLVSEYFRQFSESQNNTVAMFDLALSQILFSGATPKKGHEGVMLYTCWGI